MSWLKLDDRFDSHPKLVELSELERWRWVRVLLYCARGETDGLVSTAALREMRAPVARLVGLGLLEHVSEGVYRVHDFLDFNPSKDQRERDRERWRNYKREVRGGDVHGGHSRDSIGVHTRESPVPSPKPLNPRSAEAPAAAEDRADELAIGRLLGLLEASSTQAEYVRGLALRSPAGELERLTREIGAGVVDPLAYALERLGRVAA